jgi:hypothetical protein
VRGGRQVPRGPGDGLAEHLSLAAQAGAKLGEVAAVGLQDGLGLRGERLGQATDGRYAMREDVGCGFGGMSKDARGSPGRAEPWCTCGRLQ